MEDIDDSVNFGHLQKELSIAVAKDEKYQRENDAKFRAISQKVANYDEFRDIVEASHLKPLDRKDKLGGMAYQKWNAGSTEDKNTYTIPVGPSQSQEGKLSPKNQQEFMRIWKRVCQTSQERLEFLFSIDLANLRKFTFLECPVGEMVSVLNSCTNVQHYVAIVHVLDVIRSSKRFPLQMSFLGNKEKSNLTELFTRLCEWNSTEQNSDEIPSLLASLKTPYLVTE